jgi:hypothetical protein
VAAVVLYYIMMNIPLLLSQDEDYHNFHESQFGYSGFYRFTIIFITIFFIYMPQLLRLLAILKYINILHLKDS